jgi:hypothetical protein
VRRTTSIVVAAGPPRPGVAVTSPGKQATPEIRPHHPAVSTAATLASRHSRRQRVLRPPAVARRARAAAGPAIYVATQKGAVANFNPLSSAELCNPATGT